MNDWQFPAAFRCLPAHVILRQQFCCPSIQKCPRGYFQTISSQSFLISPISPFTTNRSWIILASQHDYSTQLNKALHSKHHIELLCLENGLIKLSTSHIPSHHWIWMCMYDSGGESWVENVAAESKNVYFHNQNPGVHMCSIKLWQKKKAALGWWNTAALSSNLISPSC